MTMLEFWTVFSWELIGTFILILLGVGVNAGVTLKTSKAYQSGWIVIALGWGLAVFAGASVAEKTGGHLNPAVTIAMAFNGDTQWKFAPVYILAQLLGAILGAIVVYLSYKSEFDADREDFLGVFATVPANESKLWNFTTEFFATFVLVFFLFATAGGNNSALGYAAVAFIIIALVGSLGGPTGAALNPARDLGPRIAHAILPFKGKQTNGWNYALVPIVAPIVGSIFAYIVFYYISGLNAVI